MRLFAALSLLILLSAPALTLAQSAPAPAQSSAGPASAREAFRRGEAAYSAGNYDAAVREWTNAYAADPRPRIQFNLSQAYERMGQLEKAIDALKRFLESGDPEDPTYSDANARLVALQQRLAATGVVVQGGPEGGSILVDGQDWGRTPRPDKITTPPGNHEIVVRWASGREFRTNAYVPAGQVVNIEIPNDGTGPATATQSPAGPSVSPTTSEMPPPTRSDRRVLWYSLGGGVAGVGLALTIYGATRIAAQSKCGGDTYCDPDSRDAAKTQGIAGIAAGSALVLGGAALFVVGALTGRHDDTRSARTSCGVGYGSAACTFRF
jgi:hypothetical protein